jgi:hypothetical protein
VTLRREELRFYFMPEIPDELTVKNSGALNKEFMRYLKGNSGHQVTRNVLG